MAAAFERRTILFTLAAPAVDVPYRHDNSRQDTPMNLTTQQLAELLAGIVRSQQAIIDAIESDNGGWRNTHLLPKLNTAANMRMADPRLLDVPSRVLLRSQGRVPMDTAAIARMLETALGAVATNTGAIATGSSAPAAAAPSAKPDDLNFFDS